MSTHLGEQAPCDLLIHLSTLVVRYLRLEFAVGVVAREGDLASSSAERDCWNQRYGDPSHQ